MKIKTLKKLLYKIRDDGYGDWELWMCDDDDEDYSINHIYRDDDGDICIESTEDGHYDFTANNILNRIRHYGNDNYVYFLEEYEDSTSCAYDIEYNWYIGTDDDGNDILNVDCTECDGDD